jgi:TolA-binding protein
LKITGHGCKLGYRIPFVLVGGEFMKKVLNVGALVAALTLALGVAIASAQSVTTSDIQRLQDRIYDADTQISSVRAQNASLAADMRAQLDDLRDEVTYLKVKLRKEGTLSRSEYQDVSNRIDQLANRARSEASMAGNSSTYGSGSNTNSTYGGSNPSNPNTTYGSGSSSTTSGGNSSSTSGTYGQTSGTRAGTRTTAGENADVPAGTQLDVRLQDPLSTKDATVEQRFSATTAEALRNANGTVLIPAGSVVRGVISDVKKPGRVDRNASLTLSFDQITISGRNYPIRATVAPFENQGAKGDAAKIGTGAGVGAIFGGILGGFKGALAGILIGGGGVVAATQGQDVDLPAGTVLRIRLDSGLNLR